MCEVVCPYKGKCKSEGYKCQTCANNTGKKDYYQPDTIPWYPYYPWTVTVSTTGISSDYYTSTSDNTGTTTTE